MAFFSQSGWLSNLRLKSCLVTSIDKLSELEDDEDELEDEEEEERERERFFLFSFFFFKSVTIGADLL